MTAGSAQVRDEIRRLRIELEIANDAVAGAARLNPRDLDVLDVIDREGPCSPTWLADRTGQRRATLTSVLRRLEGDGWIARRPDPADGRSAIVGSTDRFDELRALYAPLDAVEGRLAAEFTADELAVITRALALIADHVHDAIGSVGRSSPRGG